MLKEAIGIGGMGAVFRAVDEQLNRVVALKILPSEQAKDPEAVQRFYQEGRAAARLDHENIARVFAIGHASNTHYIAFEYIDGNTLRQRVDRGGVLSVGDTINYTLQITAALVHASERGVVHRDVKPSNIIVTSLGRAKLVDMGLARHFERGGDTGLTQTGMTLGTFDYISPEQARDPRSVDVRSDLYSLGCTVFYMLAGRPPFPDGTVLQKLLQHQEEPPPDIRGFNPSVPADLAAILIKLMAKDRDRRYQSPEQLVRDLLLVAGSLNLRSVSPEGLVWMDAAPTPMPTPAWERHLVWGIPTLAFAIILCFLIWNSQQGDSSPSPSFPPEVAGPPQKDPKPIAPLQTSASQTRTDPTVLNKSEVPAKNVPREVVVRKTDDLGRLLLESASGTTLVIADDGPYDLRPGPAPLTPRDLTVRAGVGLRPVIRLARDSPLSGTASGLIDVKGGRLTIDGIELQVGSDDRDAPLAAVRTQGTELTLMRCVVRQVGPKSGRGQTTGLHIRETTRDPNGKGPADVVIDASHFDGGQIAIATDGPVDLTIRDTTIGVARTSTIACNNQEASDQVAVVRLNHVSLLAGDGPVFHCSGVSPRIQVIDSVIAPPGEGEATLVSASDPARLDWRGRDNLYSRFAIFLQADRSSAAVFNAIRSFKAWADDPTLVREAGSSLATERVWAEPDPSLALTNRNSNPSLAFRLGVEDVADARIGARRGPFGAINRSMQVATSRSTQDPTLPIESSVSSLPAKVAVIPSPVEPNPTSEPADPPAAMTPMRDPDDEPLIEVPPLKERIAGGTGVSPTQLSGSIPAPKERSGRFDWTNPVGTPKQAGEPVRAVRGLESRVIRTAAQLTARLGRIAGPGETLHLASDADLEMPACELRGAGSWLIRGEPGKTRPRIRFRPRAGDLKVSDSWTVWLNLRSGNLRLEHLDFVLAKEDAPRTGGWGVFAVAAGSDLIVSDCTVTIEGSPTHSAVIVALSGREAHGVGDPDPEPLTATVRLKESLFRVGGDLVDVASDRRLDLEVDNALITTSGSLLHGHGRTRGVAAEPLKLTFRRLTARTEGGLLQLESTANDPELPQAEVVARDSVLTTNGNGSPLIQVDGQDDPESLRDRVRWDGNGIAYHQITNYRRDQVLKPGELPTSFDRTSWALAVGHRESGSIHGGAMFFKEWPADRPVWLAQPTDFRLKPESSAVKSGAGSALELIPDPPAPS